ncbi:MAG: hypothetical protein ACLSVD_03815 [Eggerthellaceae bacterium]
MVHRCVLHRVRRVRGVGASKCNMGASWGWMLFSGISGALCGLAFFIARHARVLSVFILMRGASLIFWLNAGNMVA